MRWWHFGVAAAAVGIGLVALAGTVAAQTSTNPNAAAPAVESADSLNAEVIRLYQTGKYADAIPLARRALALSEMALGPDHPSVGIQLNNLALLYQAGPLRRGRAALEARTCDQREGIGA